TYRILKGALKGWKYPSESAGVFPVRVSTMKRVIDLYIDEDSEKEQNDFNGFVTVKKNDQWDPFIITLEQQEQWSYDENKVEISSDYVTNFVTKLSFNSSDNEEVNVLVY